MELRQLKYFTRAAEIMNFSEASRQLHITQSTLSQQIKQLEAELGVELFIRDSHHVRLTDIGEAFLPEARRTISAAETCWSRIQDVKGLEVGELNIGSTYTFLPLLKETVLDFYKTHPKIKINLYCHSMETLMKMVNEEKIDVALSYKPNESYPGIDSHILFDNRLVVAVSETNPVAKASSIRLPELENLPLAMPAKGLQARNCFDRLVCGQDYRFNVKLEVNEVNLLLDIVRESNMATVISHATVARVPGLKALTLDTQGTSMEGAFNVRKGAYMKLATKEFLRLLCENKSYSMALMELF
ncbi:MAG: LysR family transcriptional regulator [Bacteroidaceae bacterium]|nr:LysR family transcriptional regulator [Bacteroidaceae bacterium]